MRTQRSVKVLLSFIALLLIAILGLQLYTINFTTEKSPQPPTVTKKEVKKNPPATIPNATTTKGNSLYDGITDATFVTYATDVIDKRCPFYEPNGVVYRECLSDWLDALRNNALVEENGEVNAYCEVFSKKYADVISFQESELFTKCAIYMLK